MKKLFSLMGNYGGVSKRTFIFLKDKYGHNRVNIGCRYKFFLHKEELLMLLEDPRFNQNAFITEDRIMFNGLKVSDLTPEEKEMYKEDTGDNIGTQ